MTMTISNSKSDRFKKAKAISRKFDIEVLLALGFEEANPTGVQCSCPIHGGDNCTAFSYDSSKKIWSCFTHQCHTQHGNDMIGLIRSILGYTFEEAVSWISDNIGIKDDTDVSSIYQANSIEDYIVSDKAFNKAIDESKLKNLEPNFSLTNERGFDENIVRFFEAGLCKSGKIVHQRLMIPIRSEEGGLVGFTGRTVHPLNEETGGYHPVNFTPQPGMGRVFSKWRMYPKNFNKSIELYNMHNASPYIRKTNKCFVVEGPFDVWRLWSVGIKNCVATMGTGLTKAQASKLLESGCVKMGIAYDSDSAGVSASNKIKDRFKEEFDMDIISLPRDKDPADLSEAEIGRLFQL